MVSWALDLDGVLWRGERAIPGAASAVNHLIESGHPVGFVTNNSFGTRRHVEGRLSAMGVRPGGVVITSAMVVADLVEPGERVMVCGGPGVTEELLARGASIVDASDTAHSPGTFAGDFDAVVVGFHPTFDYARMTAASAAVRRGARLLATNADATYPTSEGIVPGGGAILASIVTASGVGAVVAGKPEGPMVARVRSELGDAGLMVGDRPDTDGRFATALGYRFGLVLSGVTSAADLPVDPVPDEVAGDLAEMVRQALPAAEADR